MVLHVFGIFTNIYFLIAKRIELNLEFEPITNAPNLHIKLKGDW
jgi:hypothetical protein